jgi:hypothetical protein
LEADIGDDWSQDVCKYSNAKNYQRSYQNKHENDANAFADTKINKSKCLSDILAPVVSKFNEPNSENRPRFIELDWFARQRLSHWAAAFHGTQPHMTMPMNGKAKPADSSLGMAQLLQNSSNATGAEGVVLPSQDCT